MNHRPVICLLVAFVMLWGVRPAKAITTAPTWKPRQLVATNVVAYGGSDQMLAYDHHGNPGVAYANTSGFMMYARYVPGAGWQSAIADAVNTPTGNPSLAYDRRELPWIGHSGQSMARVTSFNGTNWISQQVSPLNSAANNTLAIDSTGRVATAFRDGGILKYVKDNDGDGLITDETAFPITSGANQGHYATLAFDPLDRPMIAHFDITNGDLKFSVLDIGLGWVTTTVDSTAGAECSLAIDPDNGYPAIAYFESTLGVLRYAAWDGATWVKTTVDTTAIVGVHTSLAFDPADGNPAISYQQNTNSDLKFAWFNGTSWQTQLVDAVGNVGVVTSLAFNNFGTGFPSIVYGDSANNLWFIEDPPASVPEPQTALMLAVSAILFSARHRRRAATETD